MRRSAQQDSEPIEYEGVPMKSTNWVRWLAATMLAMAAFYPPQVLAQVPARFYWKSLSGANAVPVIFNSLSGNTNPFDPSNLVTPNANIEATMALTGWAHTYTLFDRAAMGAIILPMGHVSGGVAGSGDTSRGFGDPTLEFNLNLIGPKAQKTIPDVLRYEPGFSLDLLADLMVPIGEYDSNQSVNLGQNRWYGRIGAPIVWQLGAWVPGRRTTLELLPAVWLFGDNSDFVGQKLKTDPMFQVDAHLTRDFTQHIWGGLDLTWYKGGGSTINGVPGGKLNNVGVGLTLGYTVNENLNLTVGYKSTVNDSAPTDMRMDGFMVTLVFGWHPIIEGMRRLKSE
jgi:hypothetical protein